MAPPATPAGPAVLVVNDRDAEMTMDQVRRWLARPNLSPALLVPEGQMAGDCALVDLLGEEAGRLLADRQSERAQADMLAEEVARLTAERDGALRQLDLAREHRDEAVRQRDLARAEVRDTNRAYSRLLDAAAAAGRVTIDAAGTVTVAAPSVVVDGGIIANAAPSGWDQGGNVR